MDTDTTTINWKDYIASAVDADGIDVSGTVAADLSEWIRQRRAHIMLPLLYGLCGQYGQCNSASNGRSSRISILFPDGNFTG